jgi:hypothetical protein
MSVVVGRVRSDSVFSGVKYVALGNNTIRGAASCALLIAESITRIPLRVIGYWNQVRPEGYEEL